MFEGPAIVILWLMTPAIIAIGGLGGAIASDAIGKFWATQAGKPPEKAQDAPMLRQLRAHKGLYCHDLPYRALGYPGTGANLDDPYRVSNTGASTAPSRDGLRDIAPAELFREKAKVGER